MVEERPIWTYTHKTHIMQIKSGSEEREDQMGEKAKSVSQLAQIPHTSQPFERHILSADRNSLPKSPLHTHHLHAKVKYRERKQEWKRWEQVDRRNETLTHQVTSRQRKENHERDHRWERGLILTSREGDEVLQCGATVNDNAKVHSMHWSVIYTYHPSHEGSVHGQAVKQGQDRRREKLWPSKAREKESERSSRVPWRTMLRKGLLNTRNCDSSGVFHLRKVMLSWHTQRGNMVLKSASQTP